LNNSILTTISDTLGTAKRVGNFENGSPEWHALRRTGIGGSDIAAICQVSPWTSPFALWAKKTGRIPDDMSPSEAAEWGTLLEPVVIDKFEKDKPGLTVVRNVGTWSHVDREWQLANPDALLHDSELGWGILEIKTAQFEDDWNVPPAGEEGTAADIPVHYRTQIQWYLHTFGFSWAYCAALFHGNKFRTFRIEADTFEQEANMVQVEKFLHHLANDVQPDYDGALSTYEAIREMNPDIQDDEVELADLGMHLVLETQKLKEQEELVNRLKSEVLDTMGKAKRGLVHDIWTFTRQARGAGKPFLIFKRG
jgi:putative phage-type endonuclease